MRWTRSVYPGVYNSKSEFRIAENMGNIQMKLLLFISLAIAIVCVLFVAVTQLWFSLLHALMFLVILFLVVVIVLLLFRRNQRQE